MATFNVTKVPAPQTKFDRIPVAQAFPALAQVVPEASGANFQEIIASQPWWENPEYAIDKRMTEEAKARNLLRHRAHEFKSNGFFRAVHLAFAQHYPLVISPDDIWLAISQGFAAHVTNNAEDLRKQFVAHEGKKQIEIYRDGFVKGSPNDWPGCFGEFSDRIALHIGKKRDLLVGSYSTTGPIERAASELVLMDCMSSYFEYGVTTCCGIPRITLLGTLEDWRSIRTRAKVLGEFCCGGWIDTLVPVLDEFVSAFQGSINGTFWQSFYNENGGSGGPFVSGAINAFFPYLLDRTGKPKTLNDLAWGSKSTWGNTPDQYPEGLSSVPFTWTYYTEKFNMSFLGGFIGTTQDQEGGLRAVTGWGIADAPETQADAS